MNLKLILTAVVATALLSVPAFSQSQIKPGRAIQVTIKGVPATEQGLIDGMYPVSDGGTINLPYIGQVRAAGLRPDELAGSIQSSYRNQQIYRNPTIQVFASSTDTIDKEAVHIGGQVRRPGPVEFTPGLTLYQAVQAAGGSNEFGSMKRVKLLRGSKVLTFDLTQAQFMRIPLEQNDVIEIPQKTFLGQ